MISRYLQERHQALMSLLATARGGIDMRNAIMQAPQRSDQRVRATVGYMS
jgi:hypothetical protein